MARDRQVIQIVVADERIIFRQGLRILFSTEADLKVVGEAGSADETIATVRLLQPEVLVMDLGLLNFGSHDGPEKATAVRQACFTTAILFLTEEDGPSQLEAAVTAGARGYMLKGSKSQQFVAAVRKVAVAREEAIDGCYMNPGSLSSMTADLQALSRSSARTSKAATLTSRETEILRLLAEGQTVREIASLLLLSSKTIEAHKLNLMRKLDIHNRATLIDYAIEHGLVNEPAAG